MILIFFWQIKYCAASCKQWSPIYGHSMYLTPFFAAPFSAKCKPTQKHHKNGFRLGNYFWHLDTRHYHHSPLWQELSNVLLKMNIPLRRLKVEILSFSDIFLIDNGPLKKCQFRGSGQENWPIQNCHFLTSEYFRGRALEGEWGGLKFQCCKISKGRSWVNQGQNSDMG